MSELRLEKSTNSILHLNYTRRLIIHYKIHINKETHAINILIIILVILKEIDNTKFN